ncbi:winged helix-turn-helix transcriptional regulator [Nonomuraea sp. NPDC049158]|uniref:winged helix-turn-helix transcriptional regulator n=1 Tax=Nonomuraea sp. NPDC049158 TaxID=3155649 RepID=UPI0033F6F16A
MVRELRSQDADCSIAQAAAVMGDWWSLLIVREVTRGHRRFDDLLGELGISRKVLTERLKHLVEHGVLTREPYQSGPVRYEYVLTDAGWALAPMLITMQDWADRWLLGDGTLTGVAAPRSAEATRIHALLGTHIPDPLRLPAAINHPPLNTDPTNSAHCTDRAESANRADSVNHPSATTHSTGTGAHTPAINDPTGTTHRPPPTTNETDNANRTDSANHPPPTDPLGPANRPPETADPKGTHGTHGTRDTGGTPGVDRTGDRGGPRVRPSVTLGRTASTEERTASLDVVADARATVLFAYPSTGMPAPLPPGWNQVPGAAGCTLENRIFRDRHPEFAAHDIAIHGVSTQRPDEQSAFAAAEDLPFPLLSDMDLHLAAALRLPTFRAGQALRLKRLILVVDRFRVIRHVIFPVLDIPAAITEALTAAEAIS